MSSAHYDDLETRAPEVREAQLMAALARQVAHAQQNTPAFAERLAGIDARAITSRAALAELPVLRKHELLELQRSSHAPDVFGGASAVGWGAARRVFRSPGPIYEPEGAGADHWRMARALYAAGFRAGELVHNAFSYHFTPAGAMMESAAVALGCTVFPAGTGQSEQQLEAMRDLQPAGYVGTPSFLRILLELAEASQIALPTLRKASVGGEAFPAALRAALDARGIAAYQSYGTADLGLIAYETEARQGLIVDEGVIVEIVRPGTGGPVGEGEVGEVVVTTLDAAYPLIRFGTGDLSAVLPGACPTGRTNMRIKGWMGRADQAAKVRGLFVHASQIGEIAQRHAEVRKARLVVSGELADDRMTLQVEVASASEGLAERVAQTVRAVTQLRGEVEIVAPGSLPNDGKVIEDVRRVD